MNQYPITEAKAKLPELVRSSTSSNVFIARHGRPATVMIGIERYEALLEELEDLKDRLSIYEAREAGPDANISIDKLEAELGLNA